LRVHYKCLSLEIAFDSFEKMEILRVPGEDLKCHFSYVISVWVAAVVTVSSSQILFSSRHRERERERICHWRIPICLAVML
jgi:hypothetical protein